MPFFLDTMTIELIQGVGFVMGVMLFDQVV